MEHIILLFFSFFTEAVILWQYASSLFTSSYSNKIKLALLSAFYAILFLISLLGQTGLNAISFFVINTIFLYMLFKLKLLLALFHSAIQQLWDYLNLQFSELYQGFFRILS